MSFCLWIGSSILNSLPWDPNLDKNICLAGWDLSRPKNRILISKIRELLSQLSEENSSISKVFIQVPALSICNGKLLWEHRPKSNIKSPLPGSNLHLISHYHSSTERSLPILDLCRHTFSFISSIKAILPSASIKVIPPLPRRHFSDSLNCRNCFGSSTAHIGFCMEAIEAFISQTTVKNYTQVLQWYEILPNFYFSSSKQLFMTDHIHLNLKGRNTLHGALSNLAS